MKNTRTNKRVPFDLLSDTFLVDRGRDVNNKANKYAKKFLYQIINCDLTKAQKQYIIMYYVDKKKMVDIAKDFGINKATVSRTITRAKKTIYDRLKYFYYSERYEENDNSNYWFYKWI